MQALRQTLAAETVVSQDEARDIIERFQSRSTGGHEGPTLADLAEVLQVPPEEVARVLNEVRASPKNPPHVVPSVRIRRRRLIMALALALAFTAFAIQLGIRMYVAPRPLDVGPPVTQPAVKAAQAATATKPANIGLSVPIESNSHLTIDEIAHKILGVVGAKDKATQSDESAVQVEIGGRAEDTPEQVRDSLAKIQRGIYDIANTSVFDVSVVDSEGLKLGSGSLPVYMGDNGKISRLVEKYRRERATEIAKEALKTLSIR